MACSHCTPPQTPSEGDVYVKAGTIAGASSYLVKISPWFESNVEAGRAQGGFLAIFDARTGHTRAILEDEHYLSDVRTAAAGAVAARLLAPPQICTAAVLGAGTQARWQVLALFYERPFKRLLIWARQPANAERLLKDLHDDLPGVSIECVSSAEAAVRTCDVLITATSSRVPLVEGNWLHAGQHITAVGADDPTKRELSVSALMRGRVFVDDRSTNMNNGDVYRAVQDGADPARLVTGELGEVLSGSLQGRTSPNDITVAKLVGIGAQDLLAAERALELLVE